MAVSQKGASSIYVHRSAIAIKQKIYLNECIRKQLLSFIKYQQKRDNILFWPNLASSRYSKQVQDFSRTPDQFCTTSTKSSQCSSGTSNWNNLVIIGTQGV